MTTDFAPLAMAKELLAILASDRDRLLHIDNYLQGHQHDPYMPDNASDEYRSVAKKATSNWMPLLVDTPAQALYVDSFRPGRQSPGEVPDPGAVIPEWTHWQESGLDARQVAIHRGALAYGHSFTLTEKVGEKLKTKGLSALKTAALFADAANDIVPYVALTVDSWNEGDKRAEARMWDATDVYEVTFLAINDEKSVRVKKLGTHGAPEIPITRFAAHVDLEGRTTGVVEPMIPLQDRINQTIFDLLIAQTYASFKVRWVTGMAPPVIRNEEGEPVLDEDGNPQAKPINHSAKRMLFAEDSDTKFGTLDESPLGGYIDSIDMSIRHLSAISQTPPHHLLGQIANLSAEALLAAETALSRKIQEFRIAFGESWERVFRLAAAFSGTEGEDDFSGEVIWRDMESKSIAQAADAYGKLAEQLNVPKRALWERVPGVTRQELQRWDELREEDDAELQLADSIRRATPQQPGTQPPEGSGLV